MAAESSNFVQPAIPNLVENGIPAAAEGIEPTEAQQKAIADHKLKDLKVKNYLFQAIDRNIMETILNKETGKHIWDSMKQKYQANKMKIHGESMKQVVIIEKILRSMTSRFDYVVCSVEESNDLDTLTIDELQSSLLVHEQRMNGHGRDEQTLKVTIMIKLLEEEVVVVELFEEEAEEGADKHSTKL
ncbi:hypothetical protein CK203_082084 [Vitis vinifera]|uniref:Retrovirus-related Pol polyprotein from transposon TNT 1-94 n=1 Tax=Vitis vinifera TaxID=29760 RepID=A0A438E1Z6_VITVI|nr:hypothetical protein CK203_082084 [Vitis vinifera]